MKQSAGILLVRLQEAPEFFLVHPGGPFFKNKDSGYWSVPKGEPEENEELLTTAIREFTEETGHQPSPPFAPLKPVVQKNNKKVWCWMSWGELDPEKIICNTFLIEWPPHSGRQQAFPEIDRAGWFAYDEAMRIINERQRPFLEEAMLLIREQKKT
jgi:predicted NUDIX family NTP pyrophosphohydrolase